MSTMKRALTLGEVCVELSPCVYPVTPWDHHSRLSGSSIQETRRFDRAVAGTRGKASGGWGWCKAVVKVIWGPFEAKQTLNGCSCLNAGDFKRSGQYDNMVKEALKQLNEEVEMTLNDLDKKGVLGRPGEFVLYTLQHRRSHSSPWRRPQGKLEPDIGDKEWCFSSWDVFGGTAEPWCGQGDDFRPRFREAYEETHETWVDTGYHGWWTPRYARRGLRRVREADARGKFDSRDNYGNQQQAIRHEFRLVRLTIGYQLQVSRPIVLETRTDRD